MDAVSCGFSKIFSISHRLHIHSTAVLRISGLNSIESELDVKRQLFLGRLITQPKMSVAVRTLFQSRTEVSSTYKLYLSVSYHVFARRYKNMTFLTIKSMVLRLYIPYVHRMEKIVRRKVSERQEGIWSDFCSSHLDLKVAQECLNKVHPYYFWSLTNQYPDLVKRLYTQVRLICNFGFNGGVPWLRDTDSANCFICKHTVDDNSHFILNCPSFKD